MKHNKRISQLPGVKQLCVVMAIACFSALTACSEATGHTSDKQQGFARINPLVLEVKEHHLFNDSEGRAVVQLDGYFIELNFEYERSDSIESISHKYEINSLEPVNIYDSKFNIYDDFTDHYDHVNIITALKHHLNTQKAVIK